MTHKHKVTEPECLDVGPEFESKPALSVPPKLTITQARASMPWSSMTDDQLQAEIDAVWSFSTSLAAQLSQTDAEHVYWMLSDDPTGKQA